MSEIITPEQARGELERRAVREKALSSFSYFADHIIRDQENPRHFALAPFQYEFCNHIESLGEASGFRALNLWPRGHLKTELGTKTYALWRYLRNNNIRVAILNYIVETAEVFLESIKTEILENERLQRIFPELIIPETQLGTRRKMKLPRTARLKDVTFSAFGTGSTTAGFHGDLFIFDDMVPEPSENRPHTPEFMEAITKWFFTALFLIDHPTETDILVTGTRWHDADPYGLLLKSDEWKHFVRVVETDGVPLWPKKWPIEAIRAYIKTFEDAGQRNVAMAQLYNDPVPAGEKKLAGYQKYSQLPDNLEIVATICATDPASSMDPRANFTAHVVILVTNQKEVYVDYAYQERVNPTKILDHVFGLERQYPGFTWRPEKVGFQTYLAEDCAQKQIEHGQYFPISTVPRPTNMRKNDYILGAIQPFVTTGRLYVHERLTDLMYQLDRFGYLQFDDLIDALAMALKGVPTIAMPHSRYTGPALPKHKTKWEQIQENASKGPRRVKASDDTLGSIY